MKAIATIVFLLMISFRSFGQETRKWTYRSTGTTSEAKLIAVNGGTASLQLTSGGVLKISIDILTDADKEYIRKWKPPVVRQPSPTIAPRPLPSPASPFAPEQDNRPVRKEYGKCRLVVSNSTGRDALVKLVGNSRTWGTIVVPNGKEISMNYIPDGLFWVYYAIAESVDPGTQVMTRPIRAAKFAQPMIFRTWTEHKGNSIYTYNTVMELTLHTVVNGNATTNTMDMKQFEQL